MELEFDVGEFVMIKRTSGKWEEGEVVESSLWGITVKVKITDNFKGKPYYGEPIDGYKRIKRDLYDTHLIKMKRSA